MNDENFGDLKILLMPSFPPLPHSRIKTIEKKHFVEIKKQEIR
jgi:hypothetical protein